MKSSKFLIGVSLSWLLALACSSVFQAATAEELLSSGHDLSDGGLAMALVESCLRRDLGVALTLPEGDPTTHLFSETAGRVLVSLPGSKLGRFRDLCTEHGIALTRLGEVTGAPEIEIQQQFTLPLDEIRAAWQAPIPAALHVA